MNLCFFRERQGRRKFKLKNVARTITENEISSTFVQHAFSFTGVEIAFLEELYERNETMFIIAKYYRQCHLLANISPSVPHLEIDLRGKNHLWNKFVTER